MGLDSGRAVAERPPGGADELPAAGDATRLALAAARQLDALGPADVLSPERHRALLSVLANLARHPPSAAAADLARAARDFGEPALVLSGGATLGFAHLGVIAALHEAGALPRILCGSSTGAMIAGGFGCRTDAEISEFFRDTSVMERVGLVRAPWRRLLRERAWLSPEALLATLRRNLGEHTFAEAHARTGRVLCIPVSPVGPGGGVRVLSHRESPDVLVHSAALASSALPGLFPPVPLLVRGPAGRAVPEDGRRWRDGSLRADLPGEFLRRELGARPLVACQTNPWVLPFLALHRRGGPVAKALDGARGALLKGARDGAPGLATLRSILAQPYRLDVDLIPRFGPRQWARVCTNPTERDLVAFLAAGREAARPHVERLRARLDLVRALAPFLSPERARANA